mmetsp:Transcript_66983/g.158055  ORF Transcript_66983/g.158055 Transcript_66983/m.158055 type:complete len:175 (-) Transcript_66983:98-622(-)
MSLGFHGEKPTNPRTDADANAISIVWGDREARVGEGLLRSYHAEFAETIPAFGVFGLNEATGIKILDFSSETTGVLRCIKQGDRFDAVLCRGQSLPIISDGIADRRNGTEACDHDALETLHHADPQACLSSMYLTASPTVAIPSAASSGISMSKASSRAITNSTVSSESAPRSF